MKHQATRAMQQQKLTFGSSNVRTATLKANGVATERGGEGSFYPNHNNGILRMTVERFGKNTKGIHTAAVLNSSGPRYENLKLASGKATRLIFMST